MTATALGDFGTKTNVPPKAVLAEGETDGSGLKTRTLATERAASAPDELSQTPA